MGVLEVLRFGLSRAALELADRAVTNPLFSWTWSGASDLGFSARLDDFRPTDSQTVIEMMDGKYLLAGRLVDTGGVSPFALDAESAHWLSDLHSFGWLRHFNTLRDKGQRRFARTLVLDWIGRYGDFDRDTWDVFVTGRRVLNWLKVYGLLTEDATPDEVRRIARSLASQIQALRVRVPLTVDPVARLMAEIALVGAALSMQEEARDLTGLAQQLDARVAQQFDADGMHLSRSPLVQIQVLSELIPVNQLLGIRRPDLAGTLARRIEAMHRAFECLVLGTREPVYMNGCGQMPVDLVLAIAAQSGARAVRSGLSGGYGVLIEGEGKLVADSGTVPPLEFAAHAHAGALSFEFSCGGTLIAGSCGPAPSQLPESRNLFRHSSAHSAPTIDDLSSAEIGGQGLLRDRIWPRGSAPELVLIAEENALEMRSPAYRQRYGLDIVRRLTLMGGGHTLVGQDRFVASARQQTRQGEFSIRFHLAPGVALQRMPGEEIIRMIHRNGESWSFLWEGAQADIEDSVRHSAHFGLVRTQQIVLTGAARPDIEIAWVFTRQ